MDRLAPLLAALVVVSSCRPAPPSTLTMLADRDVEAVDPHASGGLFQTRNVLANAYEGLATRDADLRLRPALAVSWSNPDDRTWDFALRPGVRFHDGSTLTAEDVVASFRRAREHPRSQVRYALAGVTEVSAPSPGTVRLRTREPDASLLSRLPELYVVSRGALPADELGVPSAGTGPYRIVSWRPGVGVELARFDGYRAGAAGFASVRVVPSSYGSAEASRAAEGGAVTFYAVPGTPEFDRASQDYAVHVRNGSSVQFLAFDLRARPTPGVRLRPGQSGNPFADIRVRRAVALAVDYPQLQKDVFGGRAQAATQFATPEMLGYEPALAAPRHDPAAARAQLAGTPWEKGFEVDLDTRGLVDQYVPHVQAALERLGIRALVRTWPQGEFFDHLRSGRSSLYVLRLTGRTGDAQELLDAWVHSRDDERGLGLSNFSYEVSPVAGLDEQIDAARATLDPSQRSRRLQAALRTASDHQLVVPLLLEPTVVFLSRGVRWAPRADAFRLFAEMRPE